MVEENLLSEQAMLAKRLKLWLVCPTWYYYRFRGTVEVMDIEWSFAFLIFFF